jgi:SNF2 family DNA or RNA helicase
MNYEQVRNDIDEIQELLSPDVIILDEAQRIKNWQAKTSTKIKKLQSPYAFVLTGTPVENRIDEIYSLMQVIDPTLFGPLFRFNREFYVFDEKGKTIGLKNIDRLHGMLKDVLLRRRKSEVEDQLPERLVNFYFVKMEEEQRLRYSEYEDKVARLIASTKNRPMRKEESDLLQLWLACMRMLCDTPYILDQTCKICPKLSELEEILAQLLANKENKIIIFSEWVKMLDLVKEMLKRLNIDFALHVGSVPQDKRRREINRFKEDPNCRVFLSSDSGATGLNLQVANVVINLDLPWNPAKYEQRIARAWRKHQKRAVQVINLVCEDSIEQRMIGLLSSKQALADGVLEGIGNLAEMELPSGKGAFLEKLEALMGFNSKKTVMPELVDETFESLDEMIASNYEDSFIVPPSEELFKDEILKNFS